MKSHCRHAVAFVCLLGLTVCVALGQAVFDDSPVRRNVAAWIARSYHVNVDWQSASLSELTDIEVRLNIIARIKRNHGVSFDWRTSTVRQLSDTERRLDVARRPVEAAGRHSDSRNRSIVASSAAKAELGHDRLPPAQENEIGLIMNRLEVGTRMTYFVLLNDTRGQPFHNSFVGSITKMKEDQDLMPTKIYVQYKIRPCFGMGVSYDRLGAEAWDNSGTDGTAYLSGPLLYVLGCYPNSTAFTPFLELGTAFYSAHFVNSSGWGQAGNKKMILDNSQGYYIAFGCDMQVTKQLAVNLYGRYLSAVDFGVFMLNGQKREDIIFTTSHLAFGLGAKYCF